MLNILASLVYLAVAVLALFAWRSAANRPLRWHWAGVAACFVALAAWRLGQGEVLLQAWARDAAHATGDYDQRREWQAPLVAAMLLLGSAALGWAAWHSRLAPPMMWSRLASLGLLAFSAVRAVSFHPVDVIIYAGIGPLHINHLIDMGLCAVVATCAVARRRQPPSRRRASSRAPVFSQSQKESD